MRRRTGYEILTVVTLAIAAGSAILAVAGAALQQALGVTASLLCAGLFLVPGLYFFAYTRRLRARDLALVHVAALANARGTLAIPDLARELNVSNGEAEKFLRTALREGHLEGVFDDRGRFVARPMESEEAR